MNLILDCSKKEPEAIDWKTLDVGTVFEYVDGAKGIVFKDVGKGMERVLRVLLLNHPNSNDAYFDTAAGYLSTKIKRILGKVNSIEIKE